jgi:hypothetical protein
MKCKNVKEGFLTGTTGIAETCIENTHDFTNKYKCFDISYIDPITKQNVQTRAKLLNNYYIDVSGYLANIPYGYMASLDKREYINSQGITDLCLPYTYDYYDPTICYDVNVTNGITKQTNRVKANLNYTSYIDDKENVKSAPYGYVPTYDKKSYEPDSNVSKYKDAVETGYDTAEIDKNIDSIRDQMNAQPPPSPEDLKTLQDMMDELQKQKTDVIISNETSNSNYTTDNVDITYHADPVIDISSAEVGKMWVKVNDKLVAIPYKDVSNTTLYYEPGRYIYNSASYVPNYEESVFLSKLTNQSTTSNITESVFNKSGFCESTNSSTLLREAKCNSLEPNVCASTECCVLLGGEKCVAGNKSGPNIKSNYSDHAIINRDYYYYQGKCYGNCPTNCDKRP